MSAPTDAELIDFARRRGLGPLAERMGIELTEVSLERMAARMPVEGNTQPLGLLHGGANVVLAESLGSIAANMHAARSNKYAVGVDISATHLRSATSGQVHGVATPVHLGGSVAVYQIEIRDDDGNLTCVSRLTCALRERR